MHHLLIGEGQIGQAIVEAAIGRGDTITILRRSTVDRAADEGRHGSAAHLITRVTGDASVREVLARAAAGGPGHGPADTIQACFHAPYDSREWRRSLPAAEATVLDVASQQGIPVAFPESMYGYVGHASSLREGAPFAPVDEKGRIRAELITARRAHAARTVSVLASDLIGPTTVGTWAAVATAMVIEPLVAGRQVFVPGSTRAPHSLTHIPDLAQAMLFAAEHADELADHFGTDAVVHAPTAPARSLTELATTTRALLEEPAVRTKVAGLLPTVISIPHFVLAVAGRFNRMMHEVSVLKPLWYGPCRLEPGVLTDVYGLPATGWEEAVAQTVDAVRGTGQSKVATEVR